MASLSVLASLMQSQYPDIKPYDPMDVARLTSQRTANATNLLALEDLKRQQQDEAAYRQVVQQNPGLLFGQGGQQPLLGQLSPGGAPAGGPPGPITQQAFGPGGLGAAQQVPAYPDLSQFATGGPPGHAPVLASVGPSQAPMGAWATLMQLARQSPDAALLLQRRMQQQEELGYKRQEQGLKMQEKMAETVGQLLGGAHDQASLDVVRGQLVKVAPQWASALPLAYSKAGVQPFIDVAISAKDRAVLGIQDVQAQADLLKARRSGVSNDVHEWLGTLGKTWETATPQERRWALDQIQQGKERVSTLQGAGQIKDTPHGMVRIGKSGETEFIRGPTGEILQPKPSDTMERKATLSNLVADADKTARSLEDKGFRPNVWDKGVDKLPFGLGNYLSSTEYQQYRQAVNEFASAWLYGVSGAQVTDQEWERTNQAYFPQPGEDKAAVELKRQKRANLIQQLRGETHGTGRTGGQGQPATSGGQPATPLKPVGEMSTDELKAERDRLRASGGR